MDQAEKEVRPKQAACLECRRSKVKCVRSVEGALCRRCENVGSACVVPAYHVGRYKGIKNKRTGLAKAISQVERAVKKSRTGEPILNHDQTQVLDQLLRQTAEVAESQRQHHATLNDEHGQGKLPVQRPSRFSTIASRVGERPDKADEAEDLVVDNADNPLQLLAIASSIPNSLATVPTTSTDRGSSHIRDASTTKVSTSQRFFRPIRSKLDVDADLDPISLGLATEFDAKRLFTFFHEKLAHTRWGVDPLVHDWMFVRSRSAFLFTSLMAASASFLPDTAALATRLRYHVKGLIQKIVSERYRSVDIVLGFMINIPWMIPGEEWAADDDTCYYLSLALTMALDLGLHRIVNPSSFLKPDEFMNQLARSDCVDASKALAIDELTHVEPSTELGRRLLRIRERTWLALFNLDRGVCLARGRPPTVPISPLVNYCDTWHISDIADTQDGALTSATVLRRGFVDLVSSIRDTCDDSLLTLRDGSEKIRDMRNQIEMFFTRWHETWNAQIQQSDGNLPPYVEILVSHTKLAAYCNVINHPSVPADVRKFFRAAGLSSALKVLKVAAQAESRLPSMPNNTVIMVSFAALFVFGLGTEKSGGRFLIAPSTKKLIEEVAEVLERLGITPPHRRGASAWFGKHIRTFIQQSTDATLQHRAKTALSDGQGDHSIFDSAQMSAPLPGDQPFFYDLDINLQGDGEYENFPIPDMTNDQIIDSIINTDDGLNVSSDFLYDETQFLDWFEAWI